MIVTLHVKCFLPTQINITTQFEFVSEESLKASLKAKYQNAQTYKDQNIKSKITVYRPKQSQTCFKLFQLDSNMSSNVARRTAINISSSLLIFIL